MNLGDKLIEIRKENKMSQESFAETLGVTRQTVSNWENYKNYPDINTLIKISDKFNISLDILLKGDKKMINKIDKEVKNSKKYKNRFIILITILLLIILSFSIYSIKYTLTKNNLESKFQEALKSNKFHKNKEGYYSYNYSKNIVFGVPKQKMPSLLEFKMDFKTKELYCDIVLDNGNTIEALWNDYNNYIFALYNKTTVIASSASIKEKDRINIAKLSEELNLDESYLENIINKGNKLYKDFYK